MTPAFDAPSDFMMPISRVFSATIMLKIARIPKPATAMIMKRRTLRIPFSMSMAASSEPCFSSHV